MEEDSVPKFMPYDFIYVMESDRQQVLRRSYNWRATADGMERMEKKEPSTPQNRPCPTLDFQGQCFDENDNAWTHCIDFNKDGSIDDGLDTSFHKVRSVAGDKEMDLDQALDLVANASKAAGAVFISPTPKDPTRLSGFFISDRFFVTCAHFNVTPAVEKEMMKSSSEIAAICTKNKPHDKDKSVHLVLRNRDYDLAIFCLNTDQLPQQHYLDIETHFPGVDKLEFEPQLANRRAFAIGYNAKQQAEDFPNTLDRVIANLTPEKRSLAKAASSSFPDFDKIFCPDRKTLSVGRLDSKPPGCNAVKWNHRITGWYGISGAMIACLDESSGKAAKVQVLGLFSNGVEGNQNGMVRLTSDVVGIIRDAIRSHK